MLFTQKLISIFFSAMVFCLINDILCIDYCIPYSIPSKYESDGTRLIILRVVCNYISEAEGLVGSTWVNMAHSEFW